MVGFGEDLYMVACALDPSYAYCGLMKIILEMQKYKSQIKDYITGNS